MTQAVKPPEIAYESIIYFTYNQIFIYIQLNLNLGNIFQPVNYPSPCVPQKPDLDVSHLVCIFVITKFRNMNRRLLQFLQAENLTQTQFADTLSVARGSVSHILSGRNKPGYDFLESLMLHYPALNLEWLLTGRGKMYKDAASEDAEGSIMMDLFPQKTADSGRKVNRILVFYSDNTFEEFHPEE